MKIGIDVYQAAFRYGGIPRYVRALVAALSAAAPTDHFILASNHFRTPEFGWRHGGANVTHVNLRVPRHLMQAAWDRLNWPPVEAFLGAVDVFHGTHFVLPPVRAAKRVLTVHDVTFLRHPEYFSDRITNERWHRRELLVALGRADAVIADSRNTMDDLVDIVGYPKERIRVIPLGVEPGFFVVSEAAMPAVKHRYGLDRPYLVFLVGSPEPRKNLQRTVAAARLAAPDLPLAVIGPPESIRTMLGGDCRGVILPGVVPDADLPFVLHGAELALYPSLYEGFGLPALEALATGVPLITSDRSSLPEIVENAAVLVNPESVEAIAEAIRVLLADSDRRERLAELGRMRARELSWERTASHVLQLYRAVSGRVTH